MLWPLPPTRLSEYDELSCLVSQHSTIRVKKVTYSVPARLIGQTVRVEVYEGALIICHGRELLLRLRTPDLASWRPMDHGKPLNPKMVLGAWVNVRILGLPKGPGRVKTLIHAATAIACISGRYDRHQRGTGL